MRRWRRFFALDAAQRGVLLWSLVLLPFTAALLRLRGFAAARAVVGRMPAPAARDLAAEAAARIVDAAAALLGVSCLPRSLVLWRLLRARGAAIRFGVSQSAALGFAAHAWVELDGKPVNDRPDVSARYAPLRGAGELGA